MPKSLTIEQLQNIKRGIEKETPYTEIAKEVKVSKSTVERVQRVFLKTGKFNALIEKLETQASKSKIGKNGKRKNDMNEMTPARRERVISNAKHLRAQGLTIQAIGKKLGVSHNTIWYWTSGPGATEAHKDKGDQRKQEIIALREKGLSLREIAKKLHIPSGTVSSRLYSRNTAHQTKEQTNGASSSPATAFSRDIRIGIAFAEVERFIGVLSERLGEPAKVLRPRLSELLGHSPLRQEPGDGD